MSASFSSRKLTTTCEMPSAELEFNWSMPLMVFTASSTLSVISLSTCSGAAPGSLVVTVMVGMSMLGIRSTPSCVSENEPTTTSDMMRTDANTGRRTHRAANACIAFPLAFRL